MAIVNKYFLQNSAKIMIRSDFNNLPNGR